MKFENEGLKMRNKTKEERKPIIMRAVTKTEMKFFQIVGSGQVERLKEFILKHAGFNKNCLNHQGLSALHIAIYNQDTDVVKHLTSYEDIDMADCILHAVAIGNARITITLLNALKARYPDLEFKKCPSSADYSRDTTPLMLAAQRGDLDMILILLRRKHTIRSPHHLICRCRMCHAELKEAGADFQSQRLNVYRAISNPIYICLTSSDPILSAFRLDNELRMCAEVFQEFRNDYLELANNLRQFTVDMLSQCSNLHEIDAILKLKKGAVWHGAKFPRLQMAIAYDQKEFVAHPGVQQIVTSAWHGEWVSWGRMPSYEKIFYMLLRILMLPFIAAAQLTFPQWKWSVKWRCPLNKFLNEQASFIVFVFLVFSLLRLDTKRFHEGPPNTGLEIPVVVWVTGFIWDNLRRLCLQGWKRYCGYGWNLYDLIMQMLYLAIFGLWIVSPLSNEKDFPRKLWPAYHYTLVHESLLCIAAMMTLTRSLYYFQQDAYLGPLQRSLVKMIKIIHWVLLWMVVIICSIAIVMTKLHAYYRFMKRIDKSGKMKIESKAFRSLSSSMMTLFWAMFGIADPSSPDIVVSNVNDPLAPGRVVTHDLTQAVGKMLFAIYHILIVIMLVNILVAILIDTFQKVQNDSDKEWKFLRTRQCTIYLQDSTTLPSPFNLIPNWFYYTQRFIEMAISWKLDKSRMQPRHKLLRWLPCCYVEASPFEDEHEKQKELIAFIVRRYIRNVVQKED